MWHICDRFASPKNNVSMDDSFPKQLPTYFSYNVAMEYVDTLSMDWIVQLRKSMVAETFSD